MKPNLFTIFFCGVSLIVSGQDISGQWNGMLKVQGMQLRLIVHIEKTDEGIISTLDSPDQGAFGLPVDKSKFENNLLTFSVTKAKIEYEGILGADNMIVGTFKQGGQSFPLDLKREAVEKEVVIRPQEPVKPYPYYEEEVTFRNEKGGFDLAGTLTLPKKEGVYPVVVLISGSGPQNRDEELLGHKPFLVLSDYLTRNGIAVLRYDDRGTAESDGDFKTATTADFATDVEAAVAYLKKRKEINQKQIGLIGHSEGGIIAPMVAVALKDISFIILLAGTGIPGDQLLLLQQELIGKAAGMTEEALEARKIFNGTAFDMILQSTNPEKLKTDLTALVKKEYAGHPEEIPEGISEDENAAMHANEILTPWMQYFIKYNPALMLEKVKCPVLALNGEKDLQVPPKENLSAIEAALKKGGNKNVTTKVLPGLNHLFQECTTGAPDEYAAIEQTMSPVALIEVLEWMQLRL